MTARILALLLIALAVVAEPRRDTAYAESTDRLTYAFVFGSKDTCRVMRRTGKPPFARGGRPARRLGIEWKGLPGEKLLGEFSFGRRGRPVHVALSNNGAFVVAFANRADAGLPREDSIWTVGSVAGRNGAGNDTLAYDGLPTPPVPAWPKLTRQLAEPKPEPKDKSSWNYAFVTREVASGRMLVARHSDNADGAISEMTCFVVELDNADAKLPKTAELIGLLTDDEPLFRAGAAVQLGLKKDRGALPALKRALQQTKQQAGRVAIAVALVRCGDASGRKVLRASLPPERGASQAAARALATLPPEARDADTLVATIGQLDERASRHIGMAIARIGKPAVRALTVASRSKDPAKRTAVAVILGRMDDRGAEHLLLKLVGDRDVLVRTAAARALTNPPRAIDPKNYRDFARALDATGRTETKSAALRLATLAMHAQIKDDAVLKALVDLTTYHPRAIKALQRLTGDKLITSDDWKRWWAARKKK